MCFEERKKPACCVGVWAFLSLVAGGVMFYFTYIFSDNKFLNSDGVEDVNFSITSQKDLYVNALYIMSVFAVLMGLVGLFAACKENRICTFVTACCVTPTWFLFVLLGLVLLMAGSGSQFGISAICAQAEFDLKQTYACRANIGQEQVCDQVEAKEEER